MPCSRRRLCCLLGLLVSYVAYSILSDDSHAMQTGVPRDSLTAKDRPERWNRTELGTCYSTTNIFTNFSQAMAYYNSLLETFEELLPRADLKNGYASPCWDAKFEAKKISAEKVLVVIDDATHCTSTDSVFKSFDEMDVFKEGKTFYSNVICLPSIFVIGFPKCGSTYLHCLINHILYSDPSKFSMTNEQRWWVGDGRHLDIAKPTITDVCQYLAYFIPGLDLIANNNIRNGLLFDRGPNFMYWPRYDRKQESDDPFVNFCLLPSIIPHLIPEAKFIVIMRNPVEMLYSSFFYSCYEHGQFKTQEKGKKPALFHERITERRDYFIRCLVNKSGILRSDDIETNYNRSIHEICRWERQILYECVHKLQRHEDSKESIEREKRQGESGRTQLHLGFHYLYLKRWLTVIPQNKFLFITLDDLSREEDNTAGKIAKFLDVKSHYTGTADTCNKNSAGYKGKYEMLPETRKMLVELYRPFNELLADLLHENKYLWNS